MTNLDRFVVAVLFGLVAILLFAHVSPEQGRRPLPPPSALPPPPPPAPQFVPRGREAPPPGEQAPLPAPPERVRRPPLLPPAASDPLFAVDVEALNKGAITLGTAFSVNPGGIWLTARHAANDFCQALVIVIDGRPMPATLAFQHPEADLAVVETGRGAPPMPLGRGDLAIGDSGFSFGYPTGVLGATEDTLMGRSRMQLGGRLSGTGPVLTWAEGRRFPETLDRLGGMSGGPMFDASGRVIGVIVAATVRRGRVHSIAPEMLAEAQRQTGLFAAPAAPGLDEIAAHAALPAIAADLDRSARMARIYCKIR